nr:hypothetical protein [Tanacetum cinerariifolium]
MTKGKSEKGKKDKEKSEKSLLAESFDWDNESVSSNDERSTKIRAFMAIVEDEPSIGKVDARFGQLVDITMKNVHKILSMTNGDERKHVLDYTHVDLHYVEDQRRNLSECDSQEPLPPLPKLIGVAPSDTSKSLISLFDLTINMAGLTLDTHEPKKTRPSVKVSPAYVIKKKTKKPFAGPK